MLRNWQSTRDSVLNLSEPRLDSTPGEAFSYLVIYFCRSRVAVPSATVIPTAGGVGSVAPVVPATVTMYFLPSVTCTSWFNVTAAEIGRMTRRKGRPSESAVDVVARPNESR